MSDNKKNEQNQNAIDNLNTTLTEAGQRVAANKKIILWVVSAIVLAGVIVLSYIFFYHNPRLNKSDEAFGKADITALGNDTIAAKEYAAVADAYKGTDTGHNAALFAAESYFKIGKFEDAAKYLKDFKSGDELLNANAEILLGDCYVNLKKYDDALAAFDKAIKTANGNPQIAPRALMKKAVVFDEQKKYDQALACYETIQKDFPQYVAGNLEMDAYIAREKARLGK